MGDWYYRDGFVVSGDYSGLSVYRQDNFSFVIVSNDENGKIKINSIFATNFTTKKEISKNTVDHYEEVSCVKTDANPNAIAEGLFWAGPLGGLLGAAMSKSESYDLAIYFKDGEKSLIRINNSHAYQDIKRVLFKL